MNVKLILTLAPFTVVSAYIQLTNPFCCVTGFDIILVFATKTLHSCDLSTSRSHATICRLDCREINSLTHYILQCSFYFYRKQFCKTWIQQNIPHSVLQVLVIGNQLRVYYGLDFSFSKLSKAKSQQHKYIVQCIKGRGNYGVGCPSKLVSIRNNRNSNRNQFRHYPKQNVCFGCFASVPKQRVSMFRLNRNKQETNRNSLIGSIFCYFLQKMQSFSYFFRFFSCFSGVFVFSFFSVCFETVCFGCFASIPKQRVLIVPKQTEDPTKQFKRQYIWKFFQKFRVISVCFGLLRNRSVCFGFFDVGSKHRNKPKFFLFGFPKQTETNAKQILFWFVSVRTENYFCLFRGHPTMGYGVSGKGDGASDR